ncbi:MAG: family 16 glycosylhydrolase [Bacteroidota bacterium]
MKNYIFFSFILGLFIIAGCEQEPVAADVTLDLGRGEAAEMDGSMRFSLVLSEALSEDLTVSFAISEITAEEGTDYELPSIQQVVISAGSTTGEIVVPIIDDGEAEIEEAFLLEITNNANVRMMNNPTQATITSDDLLSIMDEGFTSPISYGQFTLVWEENFEGPQLDPATWNYETGFGIEGNSNNELQDYRRQNAYVQDGYLILDVRQEPNGSYTSARINTDGKRTFQFGRIDIRAKLPEGKGIRPGLAMLGENFSSVGLPQSGALELGYLDGSEVAIARSGAEWFQNGQIETIVDTFNQRTTTFTEEFHVYSIFWEPTQITWYVDGIKYNLLTTTPEEMDEFRQAFFFVLGASVGGDRLGEPDTSTRFPQRMIVDYIRVYQQ